MIFGAGYIGLELADALRNKGYIIHLVDYMPNVLSRYFDKDMINSFQNQLQTKQINFYPNEFLIDWKKSEESSIRTTSVSNNKGRYGHFFCPNSS